MNHSLKIWMGWLLILSAVNTIDAQILSTSTYFQVNLDDDMMPISIGSLDVNGIIYGVEADSFINLSSYQDILDNPLIGNLFDTSILENPHAIPIIGDTYFDDVDKVTIIDLDLLNDLPDKDFISFDDIQRIIDNTTIFYNVDIQTEQCIFGTNGRGVKINQQYKYSLSSILSTSIIDNMETPMLAILAETPTHLRYLGDISAIVPLSDESLIKILDSNNIEVWNKTNSNIILLIEDDNLSFTEKPALLPISSPSNLTIIITPSVEDIDPTALLNQIPSQYLEDFHIPYYGILPKISSIINGALIIIDEEGGNIIISNTFQKYHSFSVIRSGDYTISIDEFSNKISGNGKLFFLGDHFYNSQAADDPHGIGLPYLAVILWIIAIVFLLLKHLILKQRIPHRDKTYHIDKKIKISLIILHIISIIATFILLDQEINYQLGMSLLSSLSNLSIITGAFAALQITIWAIGYISCSIPVAIIINFILYYLNFSNKHISKSIGIPFIWIFAALYTTMLLNIFLLFIPTPL